MCVCVCVCGKFIREYRSSLRMEICKHTLLFASLLNVVFAAMCLCLDYLVFVGACLCGLDPPAAPRLTSVFTLDL